MKKFISVLLSFVLIISIPVVSLAKNEKSDSQTMLSVVKERIGSTDEFTDFRAMENEYNGNKEYYYTWDLSGDANYLKNLNVTINDKKIITSYSLYESKIEYDSKPNINRPGIDKAYAVADEFLKKINPDIYAHLRLEARSDSESLQDNNYEFVIKRYENGIPLIDTAGYLSVVPDASKVSYFNITYDDKLVFEDNDNVLSLDEAKNKYKENFSMDLNYYTEYSDNKKNIKLSYNSSAEYGEYISAKSGEKIKKEYKKYDRAGGVMNEAYKSAAVTDNAALFTETELSELSNLDSLITKEDAEKIVFSTKAFDINKSFSETAYTLSKIKNYGKSDLYIINLNFEKNSGKKYESVSVRLNAETGEIISYNKWNNTYKEKSKKLNNEKILKIADKVVTELAPSHIGENGDYILNDNASIENGYLNYIRYVDGVKFSEDSLSLSVDIETGELVSYDISYRDFDFPSSDGVITADDAFEAMLSKAKYDIYYVNIDENNKNCVLVYSPEPEKNLNVDAFSGKLLYEFEENKKKAYNDIEGHYAEDEIKKLAEFGIGFEGDEFMPDAEILEGEFVALLDSIYFSQSPIFIAKNIDYEKCYMNAISRGVIGKDEYNPDEKLTRESAACLLVKAMGYGNAAELSGIYKKVFPDVEENEGYIDILYALKIVDGDENGNFNPKAVLSRADATIMLYKALDR